MNLSPATHALVGAFLRRIMKPMDAVLEPVQARSSPPDPPSDEEAPPRPWKPPGPYTTTWDGEFLPIPPNPGKPLSQTADAIAARARRAAQGSKAGATMIMKRSPEELDLLRNHFPIHVAKLCRIHANEKQCAIDPETLRLVAAAIEDAWKAGEKGFALALVLATLAFLSGHGECLANTVMEFQQNHSELLANTTLDIERRHRAQGN